MRLIAYKARITVLIFVLAGIAAFLYHLEQDAHPPAASLTKNFVTSVPQPPEFAAQSAFKNDTRLAGSPDPSNEPTTIELEQVDQELLLRETIKSDERSTQNEVNNSAPSSLNSSLTIKPDIADDDMMESLIDRQPESGQALRFPKVMITNLDANLAKTLLTGGHATLVIERDQSDFAMLKNGKFVAGFSVAYSPMMISEQMEPALPWRQWLSEFYDQKGPVPAIPYLHLSIDLQNQILELGETSNGDNSVRGCITSNGRFQASC